MTRKEYEALVHSPGKFQGEESYVPYYWDLAFDGSGECIISDDPEDTMYYFLIVSEDAEEFPELRKFVGQYILLRESEQGFVIGRIIPYDPSCS